MRKPKTPPDLEELDLNLDRFSQVFDVMEASPSAQRYFHWDELIRRKPPGDLSHGEWWAGIKYLRNPRHILPMLDKSGAAFRLFETTPMPERLHAIDLGAGGLIGMPDQITNPQTRDQYYVSSLMEEAITSSQLEGAVTTRQQARQMLREEREPRNRSERMILNNYLTMRRIGELRHDPLTPDLIVELHRIITENTLDSPSAAGRLRNSAERVYVADESGEIFHFPPPAEELDERIAGLCQFANGVTPGYFLHPVVRAAILHFWLAYDHPFVDGNGRVARALFYWAMLHYRYWLFEFISISPIILKAPARYYRAFLYTETDDNDLTYFVLYKLDVINQAIHELHNYISRKTHDLRALEARMRGLDGFNHRQRALLSHALRNPSAHYTITSHQNSHNVVYQTARTDLLDLAAKGLLKKHKSIKTFVFTPAHDLAFVLKRD